MCTHAVKANSCDKIYFWAKRGGRSESEDPGCILGNINECTILVRVASKLIKTKIILIIIITLLMIIKN